MSELVTALLEPLAPEIERMVEERLSECLMSYPKSPQPAEWMTTAESAAYLRLTPAALRARVRRGTVRAHNDNGRWLFRRSELDADLTATMTPGIHRNGRAPRQRPRPGTERMNFDA
jgi:hypothetical protein